MGSEVRIFEFRHMIGYQCPNAARRIVTCMNTKKQSVLAVSLNVDS